jgi:hypothetical protein
MYKNAWRHLALYWFVAACAALLAAEKKSLSNADVIKMVQAELSESTIVLAVQGSVRAFDTSTDALIELKKAGVPSKVIEAMLMPSTAVAATAPVAAAPEAPTSAPALVPGRAVLAGLWGSKLTRIDADRIYMLEAGLRRQVLTLDRLGPSRR